MIKTPEEFEAIWPLVHGIAINVALTLLWVISAVVLVKFHLHFNFRL